MAHKISHLVVTLMAGASPAAAQVDPLLFLKDVAPNVIFVVDAASRMQHDAPTDANDVANKTSNYYDPFSYPRTGAAFEATLNVTAGNTTSTYRRKYHNLEVNSSSSSDKFNVATIAITHDKDSGYALFEAPTRLSIARAAMYQAINENKNVARFGLIKMRQTTPTLATLGNSGPVVDADRLQNVAGTTEVNGGKWNISRPAVGPTNNGATAAPNPVTLVKADAATANTDVLNKLAVDVRGVWQGVGGAPNPLPSPLLPAGHDDANTVDAPLKYMLDDAKTEATRLIGITNDPACRNTIVVLIVGGGQGNTTTGVDNTSLGATASGFVNISGRRVPVYVIAIAPPSTDVAGLQSIATKSGGQYFEITKAQIEAALASTVQIATSGASAPAGTVIVPEVVKAVNIAIQHAFATSADVNTPPTVSLPSGPLSEFQVTSPIVGTANLDGGKDILGNTLVPDSANVKDQAGVKIPQRSNLLVTTGFALPGFDARLRGFRTYKAVVDSTQLSGYKFQSDGTALWVACVPGTGCAAAPDVSKRNLYTVTTDGTMVAFTIDNAATLAPLMNLDVSDATAVISGVRSMPLGAIVDSTPAITNAPSLDPPPDDDYPAFAVDNKLRRSIIWVGTNNGILEGIDARFGVEVWGFIPLNLLPKLKTLRDGQPVGSFDFFVDGSPKISDVKFDGRWHTHLILGEGPGGTFYQSFDVTMADMAAVLGGTTPDSDATIDSVLGYFSNSGRITLNWAFPAYAKFDPAVSPYGDVSATASAVEKTMGQTWSDPVVGQVLNATGPYSVLVGSGFLAYTTQQKANRAGTVAGTTFYILSAKDGTLYDSKDVGSDGVNEKVDDCTINSSGCKQIKNALQSDPVATGPSNSRFVTKSYIGDLDGNLWRFDIGLNAQSKPVINTKTKLYAAGSDQPIFNSMATVNVGGTQQYAFFGTGSDLLPQTDKNTVYHLLAVLDNGATGSKTFDRPLTKIGNAALTVDERATAFPAVAGDIVFFTTRTLSQVCSTPSTNLYAFTFIGGSAYDSTGDNKVTSSDSPLVKTIVGQRATAPFIVDQHLLFGVGGKVLVFGHSTDFNNGIGHAGVRILSWREVR